MAVISMIECSQPCCDAARPVWQESWSPPSCSCPSSPSAAASRSSPSPQTSGFWTPALPPGGQSLSLNFWVGDLVIRRISKLWLRMPQLIMFAKKRASELWIQKRDKKAKQTHFTSVFTSSSQSWVFSVQLAVSAAHQDKDNFWVEIHFHFLNDFPNINHYQSHNGPRLSSSATCIGCKLPWIRQLVLCCYLHQPECYQ